MEEPVFQPFPYDGHFSPVIGSYIDPNLQPSPSDPYLGQWEGEPPQVKRWISDDQRTPLFNAGPYSDVVTSVARPAMRACPVPPPSGPCFPSPIPSSDHGLTVTSPLGETDSFYDNNNLPSTPSDTAVLSPSYHPGHPDYYSSQEEAIQFVNMGPAAPPAYVKPEDVDPSRQLGYQDAEASQPDFTFNEHRSYSFESSTSHNGVDPAQNQITVALPRRRMASPEEMQPIKMEFEASSQYPPLPDEDDDCATEERSVSKRKKEEEDDDDDDDYTPGKKIRPGSTSTPRSTRAKPMLPKPAPIKRNSTISNAASRPATSPVSKAKGLICPHCVHAPFKDENTFNAHTKKQHTRPFKCVFHFAGCTSTFASKNEWKRHNSTQHLVLHYWLCTEGPCGKTVHGSSPASHARSRQPLRSSQDHAGGGVSALYSHSLHPLSPSNATVSSAPGVRFNRKDLYTQHVRRMHMPPNIKKDIKLLAQKGTQPSSSSSSSSKARKGQADCPLQRTKLAWEENLKQRQEAAVRDRITLPTFMRCPAGGCEAEFRGDDAWDQRMEHVAKHLERGDKGEVRFGGPDDTTLVEWASSPEVGVIVWEGKGKGRWVLNKVMVRSAHGSVSKSGGEEPEAAVVEEGDEDAEGEEDDDVQC